MAPSPRTGWLMLGVVWVSWGLSYPATAIALRSFDVWTSRCLVITGAALVLLAGAKLRGGSLAVPRDHWRDLVIAALLNMSVFQICMTYGVALLSPGRTAVIVYTMPIWAALFAALMLGERLTRARVGALALGMAGLVALLSQDLSRLADAPAGAAFTLTAAVSFALGTVWMKRRRWNADLTALAAWQLAIGAVPLLAIRFAIAPGAGWGAVSAESWIATAYLILVANALAYFAWFRVVSIFPATVSGIGALAVPCVGIAGSALLVGEEVGWRELLALAFVCSALALILIEGRRPAAVAAPRPAALADPD